MQICLLWSYVFSGLIRIVYASNTPYVVLWSYVCVCSRVLLLGIEGLGIHAKTRDKDEDV